MKLGVFAFLFVGVVSACFAQNGVASPKAEEFSPPPVPDFMLKPPARPLTTEEMKRQADEASRRAQLERERQRQERARDGQGSETSNKKDK